MKDNRIRLVSGKLFDLLDPKPEDIVLDDIAHALSQVNRFAGHSKVPISVGAHSIVCLQLAMDLNYWYRDEMMSVLMHDATEAYLGDVVSPLKQNLPEYQIIEDRLAQKIQERFKYSVSENWRNILKKIDVAAYYIERTLAHDIPYSESDSLQHLRDIGFKKQFQVENYLSMYAMLATSPLVVKRKFIQKVWEINEIEENPFPKKNIRK